MKTNNKLKFSIIVPCYNVAPFIKDNFISLSNQGLKLGKDYEIIYINDCSTDDTINILETFKQPGILIINNDKNEGVSESRNIGIEFSKGEFLWFIDSDDFIKENSLLYLWEIYQENKTYLEGFNFLAQSVKYNSNRNKIIPFSKFYFNYNVYCYVIKREYVLKNAIKFPLGINQGEDTLFVFMLNFFEGNFLHINEVLYYYRQNPNSISHTENFEKHLKNMQNMFEFYENFEKIYCKYENQQALINLRNRKEWTVANICADAVYLTKDSARNIINELKVKGNYPYSLLWRRLSTKYGLKIFLLNLIRLPLCFEWYFNFMNSFLSRKK